MIIIIKKNKKIKKVSVYQTLAENRDRACDISIQASPQSK